MLGPSAHPSQPNYWTMTAGDYFGHKSDANFDLNVTNIVDLLEAKGLTWKAYQEDYPGGVCVHVRVCLCVCL